MLLAVDRDYDLVVMPLVAELIIDADESGQCLELLHKTVRKYGTDPDLVAGAARLEGVIRRA